jgi:hypothetical protein
LVSEDAFKGSNRNFKDVVIVELLLVLLVNRFSKDIMYFIILEFGFEAAKLITTTIVVKFPLLEMKDVKSLTII